MTATQTLSGGTTGTASNLLYCSVRPCNRMVRDAGSQHNGRISERNDNNRRIPMVNEPEKKA
jgi:hypothetical protein